jgi:hypothetical protein
MDHVTAVSPANAAPAENCCVCDAESVAVCGLIQTVPAGVRPTVALANFVLSATLVAVTVTTCVELTDVGAVYKPVASTLPTPAGVTDHVTAVLLLNVTVAVNCCVCPPESVAVVGATLTGAEGPEGTSVTVAEPDWVESAWLVAIIVTVWVAATVAGAVYTPVVLLMVPAPVAGLIVQVTAVLLVFKTVAVKVCVCPPFSVAVVGVTLTEIGGDKVTVAEPDALLFAWLVAVTVTVCWLVMLAGAV